MIFCVYAIRSSKGKRIYIGQCGDIEARLRRHNSGAVPSSRSDRPWTLVALQIARSRNEARWIEYQRKKSRGRRNRWLNGYVVPTKIPQLGYAPEGGLIARE